MANTTIIPITDLTNKQSKFVSLAAQKAEQSDMQYKHASVAVSNGRVLAMGNNHQRKKLRSRILCSFHAEIDVISRLLRGTYQSGYFNTNVGFEENCQQAKVANHPKVAQAA